LQLHRPSVTAFIALGANLGDAQCAVQLAVSDLASLPHTRLVRSSGLYQTAPQDSSGPDYINAVAEVSTQLCALALLDALQSLELAAGRKRPYPNAPRTLDLDLLLFGSAQIHSPTLTVPHPRMQQRAFVLRPLHEIAPQLVSEADLHAVRSQHVVRIIT
jgi:2-amino-4-hydroxy-6-hydroxymethyldihydropteridine diphosphokinase